MKVTIETTDYCEIAKDGKKYIVKEKKQVLSVEQMQRLERLGMMPSETLLTWCKQGTCLTLIPAWMVNEKNFEFTIPACTLQDILDMLPAEIEDGGFTYMLYLELDDRHRYGMGYRMAMGDSLVSTNWQDNAIDTAYLLLSWLIDNRYVGKDKK